ncbi:RNA polymerase sigma factor [Chitinophaga cymbidii]|uniref:Putative alternative RNA polymerase sigma factor SigM n=1 Tax=Chitinophaga cymbidii TaxID=1096750 RepID=A0A512RJH7_9BACT|nr:sigma-70 family RNA polymerase sigma factor [Chitinophaga cymbidii]GEP95856.1 putative alternative RNA polymerase sigma factor SigM [Chitinophaga cymbidii]
MFTITFAQILEDKSLYTDEYLFARIAEGNEAAFEQLFYRYLPKLQTVIRKIVKQEAVVNDIIHDIFLNIWVKREELPQIQAPASWIYRVMYNRSLTWVERQRLRENKQKNMRIATSANNTEEAVFFAETSRLVQEAIRRMPPQTQKIYLLSRESGLRIPEIAETLRLSPNTVKNTLVRAGKLIRDHLQRNGILLPLLLFIYR